MARCFSLDYKNLENRWDYIGTNLLLSNNINVETIKIQDLFDVIKEEINPIEYINGDVELLSKITFDKGNIVSEVRSKTKMKQFRAKPGDIIVSKINARQGAIGILENGRKDVGVTMHFRVLRLKDKSENLEYLKLALRSQYCKNEFAIKTGGIGKGEISEENLLQISLPYHSKEIQESIVSKYYLELKKIKNFNEKIKNYETYVEDLVLKSLGLNIDIIINNHTKSLDFEQLGNRWDFRKKDFKLSSNKYELIPIMNFIEINPSVQINDNESISFVPMESIKTNGEIEGEQIVNYNKKYKGYTHFEKGDILYATITPCTQNGKVVISSNIKTLQGVSSTEIFVLRNKNEYTTKLVYYYLKNTKIREIAESYMIGTTGRQRVPLNFIKNLEIPLPSIEVQKEIIDNIENSKDEIKQYEKDIIKIKLESEKELEKAIIEGIE